MKLLNVKLVNFGSYKTLDFDFKARGLLLIHGATGSGKSTLLDAATWVLYGITAKRGASDNVKSWYSPNEPTSGVLSISLPLGNLVITRIRGKGPQNDLYWQQEGSEVKIRGKDLTDSQVLLEQTLGVSRELFLTSSYFNESNRALTFFTDKLAARREFFQSILDIKLVTELLEKTKEKRKELDSLHNKLTLEDTKLQGKLEVFKQQHRFIAVQLNEFEKDKTKKLQDLHDRQDMFEELQVEKLRTLSHSIYSFDQDLEQKLLCIQTDIQNLELLLATTTSSCPSCGSPNKEARTLEKQKFELELSIKLHKSKVNPYVILHKQELDKVNNIKELLEQEQTQVNPFYEQHENTLKNLLSIQSDLIKFNVALHDYQQQLKDLNLLQDILVKTRGRVFNANIKQIQDDTNKFLNTHFNSMLEVSLFVEKDDSVEVVIKKDSYECDYTQLSKGQKGILKLCFATSVMLVAANNAGIHFDLLMFDESLDGLDAEMKLSAYGLFQALSEKHASILVIDHSSELKTTFHDSLEVLNDGGFSRLG